MIEKKPNNPEVIKDIQNPKKIQKILKITKKSKIQKTCKYLLKLFIFLITKKKQRLKKQIQKIFHKKVISKKEQT